MRITRIEELKRPSAAHGRSLVVLDPRDGAGTNIASFHCLLELGSWFGFDHIGLRVGLLGKIDTAL